MLRGVCDRCLREGDLPVAEITVALCWDCAVAESRIDRCAGCDRVRLVYARTSVAAWCRPCHEQELAEVCASCGRKAADARRRADGGGAECHDCRRKQPRSRTETCVECGWLRRVKKRFPDGPVCAGCLARRDAIGVCASCSESRPIKVTSKALCAGCARPSLARLPCRDCGQVRRVGFHDERGPQCGSCRRAELAEPCTGCGRRKRVTARNAEGPWCDTCWSRVKPGPLCTDCGTLPGMFVTPGDGMVRCTRCYASARMPCARCGMVDRVNGRWPEGPVCRPCVDLVLSTHKPCGSCGLTRPIYHDDDGGPVCLDCAGIRLGYQCRDCGGMGRLFRRGRCASCHARRLLVATFTRPDETPASWLSPLAEQLARYDNPHTAINYLHGESGTLIRRLVTGELACTHAAFDALAQTPSLQHLRDLLILVQLLPARDEQLAQFHLDVAAQLERAAEADGHLALTRYTRWELLPLAHERAARTGMLAPGQREYLRNRLAGARMFVMGLHAAGVALAECRQQDVDQWIAGHLSSSFEIRRFVGFAAAHHLMPAHIAVTITGRAEERSIMDDTDRVLLALKFESDASIPLPDRVAGCLLLQYGQRSSKIARLAIHDVQPHPSEPGMLGLNLGKDPLWLRPRLSALLRQLISERRPYAAAGRDRPTEYLFPGRRPGQTVSPRTMLRRLRAHGVSSQHQARNGALLAMVGSVHWKMLADLLGLSDTAAIGWHAAAGGDRAGYVANKLREGISPGEPE